MRITKKAISLILAVMMIASLFVAVPATASATTTAYVKVTSAPSDWSGDYLIVYEDYNKAFNGGLDTLDAAKNTIDVTINSDVIASNTTTNAAKFTVEAISGGYSIKSASGYYIGGKNGSNYLNSSKNDDFANTFAMDGENVIITSNTSVLGFNTAQDQLRFRYFKSSSASGKYVQLYKLTDSAADDGYIAEEDYLTFTSQQDDSSVVIAGVQSGSNFKYNKNGDGWQNYNPDDYDKIYLNKGEYVRFRGSDFVSNYNGSFSIHGKVAASGNIMSLRLDEDGKSQGLTEACFHMMFDNCDGLITAPELPETTLAKDCYEGMFSRCTNLTAAPELPATSLAYGCYSDMFNGCTSLTAVPDLPATSLAYGCYHGMFGKCTSLTELPELPATSLAEACYYGMFDGCSSIRISNVAGTINGIKYSEEYRIPTAGDATNASYALYNMFASTGGRFKGTPSLNTTYYIGKPVYTVTWNNWNDTELETDTDVESGAAPTFNGTTPEKAEDENNTYTFSGWSDGTNTYGLTDTLPVVTGNVTYTAQFTAVPKPKKLTLNVGENGKVVMDNGTFGNATDASNIVEVQGPIDVADETKVSIVEGHSLNLVEGGSVNIATGGEVSLYPSADNTGVITAIPAEGYVFAGWYNGDTLYSSAAALSYQNISENITLTASFTAHDPHSFENDPTFNWSQDPATGDWNCDTLTLACSCGDTQDYEVTGFFGASAVTVTANTDGSFTYSVSKKVDGVTYADTKTLEANGVVKSVTQLKAAAKKGGSWELGNDVDQVVGVSCADGFELDGNNHTVTRHTNVATNPVFVAANKNASFALMNLTIDGIADQTEVRPAIASAQSGVNTGNVIDLINVKIVNWDFDQTNNGAVLAWGQATVNLTNCNIDTDSTYDVWVGSKGTVDITGGDTGNVYLHSYSGTGAVLNAAGGADIDKITLDTTVTSTLKADIGRATVGAIEANGDIPSEVVVIDPSVSSVNAPDGYEWTFSEEEGRKTLAPIDPENPLQGKAQIIGYQNKAVQADAEGNGVRILTKIDRDWLEANADEYGYVVAKVQGKDMTANFSAMKKDGGNGEKTIDCTGTYNNGIDGVDNTYVTLAVNGMSDTDQVAARFYVVVNGVTYYANYINTISYDGIIASYTA